MIAVQTSNSVLGLENNFESCDSNSVLGLENIFVTQITNSVLGLEIFLSLVIQTQCWV